VAHCPDEDYRWRRLTTLLDSASARHHLRRHPPRGRGAGRAADAAGYTAAFYHGGMAGGAREQRHEDFTVDKSDIMVATSAFGMGIDKANIRWVAHVALPDSPDSYFQEIGRSGRDGSPVHAMLLWRAEDVAIQRFFTGGAPDEIELRELAAALRSGPMTKTALKEKTGLGPRKLGAYLGLLEQVGAAVAGSGNKTTVPLFAPLPAAAATAAVREYERQQVVIRSRTDMMRGFARPADAAARCCSPTSARSCTAAAATATTA
jgi:ATP-dependent DNA helicase RecQ